MKDDTYQAFQVDSSYSAANLLWKVFEKLSSGMTSLYSGLSQAEMSKKFHIYEICYKDINTVNKLEAMVAHHEREISRIEGTIRYYHETQAVNPPQRAAIATQLAQHRMKIFSILEDIRATMRRVYNRENVLTVKGRWDQEPRKPVVLKNIPDTERVPPVLDDPTRPNPNAPILFFYDTTLLQKYHLSEKDATSAIATIGNPSSRLAATLGSGVFQPVQIESTKPEISSVLPSQLRQSVNLTGGQLVSPRSSQPAYITTHLDAATGRTYYYNTATGKTTWDYPDE
eukprot:TRINITY_DN3750_c0_g2_i1.p1 TRINITY_DN3750_c0_g2~~TRINITY_DN3750_c0_g2_i1.p1  ORF type:complete len:285 (+),score=56.02 TRINITY_DN3750_c0_g2_i1:157-1011(+)